MLISFSGVVRKIMIIVDSECICRIMISSVRVIIIGNNGIIVWVVLLDFLIDFVVLM